jgi:DNA-binding IclR family transcriptional regulator
MDGHIVEQLRGTKTLERAFRILDLFTADQAVWGVSEISHALGLPRSTAHRVLRALERHRYLWQDPEHRKFRLGSKALNLGWRALQSVELRRAAYPVMQRLFQATGETVVLTVLSEDRTQSVCVERIDSRHQLRLILEIGRPIPLHAGASSKVMLAYLPPEQVSRVIATHGLPAVNRNTIADPIRLDEHLREIRGQGYALSFEETNEGAAGVAAPIFDQRGEIAGGLGIAGPMARFSQQSLPGLIALVREHAGEVTRLLGGTCPPLAVPAGAGSSHGGP